MATERWNRLSDWHNAWLGGDARERERMRAALAVEHPDLVSEADEIAAASADLPGFLETPAFVLAAPDLAKRGAAVLASRSSKLAPCTIPVPTQRIHVGKRIKPGSLEVAHSCLL